MEVSAPAAGAVAVATAVVAVAALTSTLEVAVRAVLSMSRGRLAPALLSRAGQVRYKIPELVPDHLVLVDL